VARYRFDLFVGVDADQLLAEDAAVLAFAGTPDQPEWLDADNAEQLLAAQAKGVLGEIGSSFELRRYAVARRAIRRDAPPPETSKPGSSDPAADDGTGGGADTALGEGIAMALDDASDRVLGGIILVTDGRSTVGIDPLDAVRRAAEASGGQPRAPVISIPIGSPEPPADIAVTDVLAAPEVALDDTVSIVATVQSSGLARRSVKVELVDNDAVAATVDLVLRDGRQQAVIPWHATKEGTSLLTIRVAPEPEEGTAENNALEFPVDVTSRKAKILVVDAAPLALHRSQQRDRAGEAGGDVDKIHQRREGAAHDEVDGAGDRLGSAGRPFR
jgi:hypothetical protein